MRKRNINTEVYVKEDRFKQLQELLIEEEREKFDSLNDGVAGKIYSLIKDKTEYFDGTITETIKDQIIKSQDQIAVILQPVICKLVKKSIINEIAILNERINSTINETFSFKEKIKRFFSKKRNFPDGNIILQEVFKPVIEELLVIEKDSGLLKGSYSKGNIANKDMVSGMLTAIKSFAEDAFSKKGQNLEKIKFETFQVLIHNFKTIYIAITISGPTNAVFNEKVTANIIDLAEIILRNQSLLEDEIQLNQLINQHLLN
jgi:hypothetical protein